jgi:hypothetical protein
MHASGPNSPSEPRRARQDDAVSEVIGHLLMLAIITALAAVAVVSFTAAQEQAEARAGAIEAQSAAKRVAAMAVEMALWAEAYGGDDAAMRFAVPVEERLAGHPATVALHPLETRISVPATAASGSARLFSAGTPAGLVVCDTGPVPAGSLWLVLGPPPATGCPNHAGQSLALYLEVM